MCLSVRSLCLQSFDISVEYKTHMCTTNYYGTKNMIQALIPLMKHSSAGGRIVSMSSRLGRLNGKQNEEHIEIAKAKKKAGETEFCSTEEQLHAAIKSLQYIIQQECILFRKTVDKSNNLKTHVDTLLLLLLYKPRFKNQWFK